MQMINWDDLPDFKLKNGKKTALTIGVFDGLHRGHQALITKIIQKAPELLPAVVTFRENPKKYAFINKKTAEFDKAAAGSFKDIIHFEEKIKLLDKFGITLCVIIDFSEYFSKISGRAFLETLNRHLCPAYIGLGENFHCGYRRDTDAKAFKALALSMGIEAEIVPPVLEGGRAVSSSRIRKALEAQNYEEASLLLGRPYKDRAFPKF